MNYDVVIATLNRPEVLKLSIPLILQQKRPPHKLIVVDASDNHKEVQEAVTEAVGESSCHLKIMHCRPNLSNQRNKGLRYVESPVVMFPDDDLLWWPNYADSIMRIYERDTNGDIGGVCSRLISTPPPEVQTITHKPYKMTVGDWLRQKTDRIRHKFDNRFCPDPLWIHGRSQWSVRPVPEWLGEENAALVELMGGARMSFRTEIIRQCQFDEDFCIHTGYSAYGDVMPSFYVLQDRLIIGARNAKAYHYRFPSPRISGFKFAFFTLFNRAYLICKYSPPSSKARRMLKRFGRYKLALYSTAMLDSYGRDRVRGTLVALKSINKLLNCPIDCLRECYLKICKKIMAQINRDV